MPFITFTHDVDVGDLAQTRYKAGTTHEMLKASCQRWERRLAGRPATDEEIARIARQPVAASLVADLPLPVVIAQAEPPDEPVFAHELVPPHQDLESDEDDVVAANAEPEGRDTFEPDTFDAMTRSELFSFLRGHDVKVSPATKDDNLRARARQINQG